MGGRGDKRRERMEGRGDRRREGMGGRGVGGGRGWKVEGEVQGGDGR